MKNLLKTIIGIALSIIAVSGISSSVQASTGVYVGKDVSADNTIIIGSTVDRLPGVTALVETVDASKHDGNDYIEEEGGYSYQLPNETYKYTVSRTMQSSETVVSSDVVINECGLTVSAVMTGAVNDDAYYADSYVEKGIGNASIAAILGASCANAQDAVTLLTEIIDKYGANDGSIVLMADQNEAWYVEIYTGHQYAAVKLPDDKVAVIGNEFLLGNIEEYEDYICSKELSNLPVDKDFAVYDDNGKLDLAKSYGGDTVKLDENHMNTWIGHKVFAPSSTEDYSTEDVYSLCYEPDSAVALEDVFSLLRNRYEGTEYADAINDDAFDSDICPIASVFTSSAHVVQLYDDVKAPMSGVLWFNPANTLYSPFVPVLSLVTEIPEAFSYDAMPEEGVVEGVAAFDFAKLYSICRMNNDSYGDSVRLSWEGFEAKDIRELAQLIRGQWKDLYEKDSKKAIGAVNDYCGERMSESIDKNNDIMDSLWWYIIHGDAKGNSFNAQPASNGVYEYKFSDKYVDAFDIQQYAQQMGWDTIVERDVLTATRDGKTIVIDYSEDGSAVELTGDFDIEGIFTDDDLIENKEVIEEPFEELQEAEEEQIVESKDEATAVIDGSIENIEDSVKDDLDAYFNNEIESIEAETVSRVDVTKELERITDGAVVMLENKLNDRVDITVDSISVLVKDEKTVDEVKAALEMVSDNIVKVLEEYFNTSIDNIVSELSEDELEKEEFEKLVNGISDDAKEVISVSISFKPEDIFNKNLSQDDIADIFAKVKGETVRIISDYAGTDISEITEEDVIYAIEAMDDETKSALGDLFGVDVDEAIEMYKNSSDFAEDEPNSEEPVAQEIESVEEDEAIIEESAIDVVKPEADVTLETEDAPTVEESVVVDEPVAVGETVAVEEPVVVEESATVEEPVTAVEEPVVVAAIETVIPEVTSEETVDGAVAPEVTSEDTNTEVEPVAEVEESENVMVQEEVEESAIPESDMGNLDDAVVDGDVAMQEADNTINEPVGIAEISDDATPISMQQVRTYKANITKKGDFFYGSVNLMRLFK